MKKIFIFYSLMILLLPDMSGLKAQPEITLSRLISMGLERNPEIQMHKNQTEMIELTIPQQGSWPDPVLSFGVMNLPTDSYRFDAEPMTQKTVELMQTVPFFGKPSIREEIAEKEHQSRLFVLSNTRLSLVNEIVQAYYDLYYLEKWSEIIGQNKSLMNDFIQIADTKYRTGQGIHQDVLKSQLEMMQLEKMIIDLTEQAENRRTKIYALLDYPDGIVLRNLPVPLDPKLTMPLDSLQKMAIQNNPVLSGAMTGIEKSKLAAQLARREYWPDFSVVFSYGERVNHPDFISGMVSVNLPIFAASKQARKVQEETIATHAAQNEYRTLKNNITLQVKLFYDRLQRDRKLFDLYRNEILPQARQALESAIGAYRADKVDFSTLLANQVTLINHEIEFNRILTSYHQNLSNLALVCGTSLDDEANWF